MRPAQRLFLLFLVLGFILASPPRGDAPRAAVAQRLPNVIIVYADDLGYADIGSFSARNDGARPRTPSLDRMAAEGVRLTNFYAAQAVCSINRS
jgi:arylsulfatase A